MHVSVSKAVNGSDNGLSLVWHQTIFWANAGLLIIGPLRINWIKILRLSYREMSLKISSIRWRPFSFGLNLLTSLWRNSYVIMTYVFLVYTLLMEEVAQSWFQEHQMMLMMQSMHKDSCYFIWRTHPFVYPFIWMTPLRMTYFFRFLWLVACSFRDHSGYGLSQWETTLRCNVVSHWEKKLNPYPEWPLSLQCWLLQIKVVYIVRF